MSRDLYQQDEQAMNMTGKLDQAKCRPSNKKSGASLPPLSLFS
jgi:hypothetical protein